MATSARRRDDRRDRKGNQMRRALGPALVAALVFAMPASFAEAASSWDNVRIAGGWGFNRHPGGRCAAFKSWGKELSGGITVESAPAGGSSDPIVRVGFVGPGWKDRFQAGQKVPLTLDFQAGSSRKTVEVSAHVVEGGFLFFQADADLLAALTFYRFLNLRGDGDLKFDLLSLMNTETALESLKRCSAGREPMATKGKPITMPPLRAWQLDGAWKCCPDCKPVYWQAWRDSILMDKTELLTFESQTGAALNYLGISDDLYEVYYGFTFDGPGSVLLTTDKMDDDGEILETTEKTCRLVYRHDRPQEIQQDN